MANGVPAGLLALAAGSGNRQGFGPQFSGSLGLLANAQSDQAAQSSRQFEQMLKMAAMEREIQAEETAAAQQAQERQSQQAYLQSVPQNQQLLAEAAPEEYIKAQIEQQNPPEMSSYQEAQSNLAIRKQNFDENMGRETLALNKQKVSMEGATKPTLIRQYQNDFDKASKEFIAGKDKLRRLTSGLSLNTRTGDATAIYNLQSLVDPGSVTREGDIVILQPGRDWMPGLLPFVNQLSGRKRFTPAQRNELQQAATGQFVPMVQSHALFRDEFVQDIPSDVDPNRLIKDYLSDIDPSILSAAGVVDDLSAIPTAELEAMERKLSGANP